MCVNMAELIQRSKDQSVIEKTLQQRKTCLQPGMTKKAKTKTIKISFGL